MAEQHRMKCFCVRFCEQIKFGENNSETEKWIGEKISYCSATQTVKIKKIHLQMELLK